MADPVISEIKFLGNGDQDFLEVRVPTDYPNPENLRLVIYDKDDNGTANPSPRAGDTYIVTDGEEYPGTDFTHFTFGTSENGTTIFLHRLDAVGLYDAVTGETFGLLNWGDGPYFVSTASGDPFQGQEATLLDGSGQTRNVTSLELQPSGEYSDTDPPTPGTSPVCFVRGTCILMETGHRRVEDLLVGDYVLTKDRGPQQIIWIGMQAFAGLSPNCPTAQPVIIKAHTFGPGTPAVDTALSPQHAILQSSWRTPLYFGKPDVLIRAKDLLPSTHAIRAVQTDVTYYHLLLKDHSLVKANGMWCESLYVGTHCMKMLSAKCKQDALESLRGHGIAPETYGKRARMTLKSKEAGVLLAP